MIDIQQHLIPSGTPLREALQRINSLPGGAMNLFVTDNGGRALGSVTDGDIRRGLIAGAGLSSPVDEVMRREFLRVPADAGDEAVGLIAEARRRGIRIVPAADAYGRIVRIYDLSRLRSLLPLDAVLMAGGTGARMRPLTLTTPKPLLPVAGKPIIDYNVEAFASFGIENVKATVNYLRGQIEEHFSVPRAGIMVECVGEPAPLGTFGSLAYVREGLTHDNLIVMNSDLLTDIDFEAMYRRHIAEGAAITVASVPYTVSVPYAIMVTEGERVCSLAEKPTYNYFANAGVYIMKRSLLERIREGERLDAPDFITSLLEEGVRIAHYPVDGLWMDIGAPDDYRCACELMDKRPRTPQSAD